MTPEERERMRRLEWEVKELRLMVRNVAERLAAVCEHSPQFKWLPTTVESRTLASHILGGLEGI